MHWSRIVSIASLLLTSPVLCQQGRAPDPHWGAEIYPRDEYEWRGTIALNRFTVYSSTSLNRSNPSAGTYNQDVKESAGLNLFSTQHTDEFDFSTDHKWTYTWTVGVGYAGDEPTQTLQNDYMHTLLGMNKVPTLQNESGFLWSGGAAINCWFGDHSYIHREDEMDDESWRFSAVVGGGVVASTLYYEPELHVGCAADFPRYNFRLTGIHRIATPIGGEIYRDVADFSQITQASIYYVPNNFYSNPRFEDLFQWINLSPHRWLKGLHDLIGRPEVGLHFTHDTGLFEDVANNGISTWFVSSSFEWSTGVRIEIWNDILNGTDRGPTFGMLVGVDLLTLADKWGDR